MYDFPPFDGTQACTDPDPEVARAFSGAVGADPAEARRLCTSCRFLTQCRTYALQHDVHGVWGDTTDDERDEIRTELEIPDPIPISDRLDEWVHSIRVQGDQVGQSGWRANRAVVSQL